MALVFLVGSVTLIKNIVTHITESKFVQMHAATESVLFEYKNGLQKEEGDFIISDNLAVGREATPDTQLPRDVVGLRVLHRTTIKGNVPPAK
jgi:alpha-ketoglutarate-dependent taurine dioxygenase